MNTASLDDVAAPQIAALPLTPQQALTLARLGQMKALLDVNAARLEQVTKWGHSDDVDANEPLDYFPRKARAYCDDAIDTTRRGRDHLHTARIKMVKAAALILAGIDRIDMVQNDTFYKTYGETEPVANITNQWPDAAFMESNLK